mmetsp:Transcript_37320/g.33473  ORF Transcript_37320/g.33473 Transcript_37320/m.33473 type:complete len:87 (+) Transcript_37320:80-340(+)
MNKYKEAISCYMKASKIEKFDVTHFYIGQTLEKCMNIAKAEQSYNKAYKTFHNKGVVTDKIQDVERMRAAQAMENVGMEMQGLSDV